MHSATLRIVLFLPENELHEIGLLFYHYIARKSGFKTYYLGQSVPHRDLQTICSFHKPHFLVTSLTSAPPASQLEDLSSFDEASKKQIEKSIEEDFANGFAGVRALPRSSAFGVYVSYVYYQALFKKIRNTPSTLVMQTRIRIRNRHKATLLAYSYVRHQLNML